VWAANVDDTSYGAWTSAPSEDNEVAGGEIDAAPFVAGDNVIAVIAKQNDEGSSDLSFDMQLKVTIPLPDPPPGGDDGGSGSGGGDGTAGSADGTAGSADGATSESGDGGSSGPAADGEGGGCSCRTSSAPAPLTWALGLLVLGAIRRRRAA
jgi:MYXO-CTERM domain-containing protein